jgi:hypothetical protein
MSKTKNPKYTAEFNLTEAFHPSLLSLEFHAEP